MKKKLLVLLITVTSTMMPNLASAIAIDMSEFDILGCEVKKNC